MSLWLCQRFVDHLTVLLSASFCRCGQGEYSVVYALQMRLTRFVPAHVTAFAITLRLMSPACSLCFPGLPQQVCVSRALLVHFVIGVILPLIGVRYSEQRTRSMFLVTKQRQVTSRTAFPSASSLDVGPAAMPVGA